MKLELDVNVWLHAVQESKILSYLTGLEKKLMASQSEMAQQLRDMKAQNEKARAENADRLKKLEEAMAAAGASTPEVDAALADLKASIQSEDDENPDATAPPAEAP